MKYLTCFIAAASTALCLVAHAGDLALADGKVLVNAFVMSERPDGLEIGHSKGVAFINFTDLPQSIQKKYNYNPENAAKYQEQVAAAKEKRIQEQAKRKADQQKAFTEDQQRVAEMQFEKLGVELEQYHARIEFLKSEIPRLEKSYNELLSKSSKMMIETADTNVYEGGNYYWGSGFLTRGGAQATKKKQAVKQITDEAAETKENLESDKKELQDKQNKFAVMKAQYDRMNNQKAAEKK